MTERSGLDQGIARIELAFTRALALIERDRAAWRLAEQRIVEQEARLRGDSETEMAEKDAANADLASRISALENDLALLREENATLKLALRDGAAELDRILTPLHSRLEP